MAETLSAETLSSDLPPLTDRELLALWREWSGETMAAGFLLYTPEFMRQFEHWLPQRPAQTYTTYEREVIAAWRARHG